MFEEATPSVDRDSELEGPVLVDPWSARPIPLTGRLEKAGFPPWMTLMIGLVLAFVLFQGISLVVTIVLLAANDVSLSDLTIDLEAVLERNAGEIMIANTVGQVFGLLIPALLFARLHSRNGAGFLRLRSADVRLVVLSIVGLVALVPVVQWIGGVFDSLPWPEFIREFEQAQMDLIERILLQDFTVMFALSMMALTPAVCEEILFRGYIQRQAERSMGVLGGILFSGLIFGLYHLRPTQAVPLGILGIYLAYLTWRSGSIIPAIIVHFANNAFAVALGRFASIEEGRTMDIESFEMPLYIVLPAAVILVVATIAYERTAHAILEDNRADRIEPEEVL